MNKFRKYAGYVIMAMLMGTLIVSFALWGIGDMLRMGGRNREVAHVGGFHIPVYGWLGGTSVSIDEVRDLFNRELDQIQRRTGQRPEPEQAVRFGLHVRALQDTVQRAVIDNAIKDYGLVVGNDEIRAAIARNTAFHGADGKFDPNVYSNRLQQARIPEATYIADIRREIASAQLLGVILTEDLAPKLVRDDIFRLQGEKRVAETIYVPDAVISTVPKPTPDELSKYFEANKNKFQVPEYRAFSYVLMTVDDVMGQVTVTPEQLNQEYDSRQAEFGSPEKRDVDQAMADSEDKAKRIIAAASGGKSLEDAAKEVLGNANGVIKLGTVVKKDLPAGPLADGVFGAPQGLDPTPIKSPLGWHVIRINKIETGKVTPFDEVKDRLTTELKAQLAPDLLIKLVNDFERALGKSQSMKTAAEELGLKVKSVDNVDARGQDTAGKQVVLGPASAELIQAAFSTREGNESDLLETPKNEYFIVRTDRVTPARIPQLSEVEAKVTDAWQIDQRRKLADSKVKEAVEKSGGAADLTAIAKDLGQDVRTSKPLTRFDSDVPNHMSQPAVQALFELASGRVRAVRLADGNVIVRLKEVQPVDLTKEKDALGRFGTQLDAMVGNDLVAEFLSALREKYGVIVNEALFAQAFQTQPQQ